MEGSIHFPLLITPIHESSVPWFAFQNKSAFLCGVMKTYRQREKQGNKVQESTKGPDESKIKVRLIFLNVDSVA